MRGRRRVLWAPRAPRCAGQVPPMTSRSPCPSGNDRRDPPPRGRRRRGRADPTGHDRDDGVSVFHTDRVPVPGDAVAAVAIPAQAGRGERLRSVVLVERLEGPDQRRVRQHVRVAAPGSQARHHHPVVHGARALTPRNRVAQGVHHLQIIAQPALEMVDPGAVRQVRPLHVRQRPPISAHCGGEQRRLQVQRGHGLSSYVAHQFDSRCPVVRWTMKSLVIGISLLSVVALSGRPPPNPARPGRQRPRRWSPRPGWSPRRSAPP